MGKVHQDINACSDETPMSESAVRGRLDVIPLLELLSALARSRKSGSLRLHSSAQSVNITLGQGSVRSVTADDESMRIGQVLIRLRVVTEEQIEQALALQSIATDPERVGEVLMDVGYISEEDISQAMTAEIQTPLNVMLDDADRQFTFIPADESARVEPLCEVSLDPLVLTFIDLTEHWLSRFTKPSFDEIATEYPLDPEALERLTDDQQELVERLIIAYHRLNCLIAEPNRHAHRVQRCVERVLKHVLLQIAEGQKSKRERKRGTDYRVQLLDREIDLWTLTDLTRSARQLLLHVLNGQTNLATLVDELSRITDHPSHAVRELVAAEIISLEADTEDKSEQEQESDRIDREIIFRLLPTSS
jgi:hypothetical protein